MTLVITALNADILVQISDRRLSSNGRLVDDESNKTAVFSCANARMAVAYCGLARWQSFETWAWLKDALWQAGQTDYQIGPTISRFAEAATEHFRTDPMLRSVPLAHKRLAVVFGGFIDLGNGIQPGFARVSNFYHSASDDPTAEPMDHFEVRLLSAPPDSSNPRLVEVIGNFGGMRLTDKIAIHQMLAPSVPQQALVAKLADLVTQIADRHQSAGTVGKQLMTIAIRKNDIDNHEARYFSNARPSLALRMPTMIYTTEGINLVVDNIEVTRVDSDEPLIFPVVPTNAPCPCGSGKRFRHCHGLPAAGRP